MKLISSIVLLFACFVLKGQDYTEYHKGIIEAEEQIFLEKQYNKGLNTYVNIFNQYDFVFLSDCMTAMQIALFAENEDAYLAIANKATLKGLIPRHLLKIPYIKKHSIYVKYKDTVVSMYRKNRAHYLARIDTAALKKMYDLYAYDQMEKNGKSNGKSRESETDYRNRYKLQIKKTVDELKEIIETKGWPSDKLIGVYQKDIMRELKLNALDLNEYYYKYKNDYNIGQGQYYHPEWGFYSTLFFAIIAHYGHYYDYHFFSRRILYRTNKKRVSSPQGSIVCI